MSKSNVIELAGREASADPLTELLRAGAQKLIYQAVEAELQELLARHSQRRTDDGKAGVVRNGYLPEREIQTGEPPRVYRRLHPLKKWSLRLNCRFHTGRPK